MSGRASDSDDDTSCSGGCFTADQVKYQYLAGYFNAHMLPPPSYRYVYLMWFVAIFVSFVLGLFHRLNLGEHTYVGAVWKKWAAKNRVYKVGKRTNIHGNPLAKSTTGLSLVDAYPPKGADELLRGPRSAPPTPRKRKIFSFPSFGRLVLLFFFVAVPICLTLIGADFIGPNVSLFDFSASWPKNVATTAVGLSRRADLHRLRKRVLWGQGGYPAVTTVPPIVTLPYRTWWTIGDRTGDITSALVPIVVIMALKHIPFAIFSMRAFGGYAFDRLSFLHKWVGRIIWLFATTHLVTWTIQLNKDQRLGDPVWSFVFMWTKFRWGWASYGFLTALMILSIGPIRVRFYEFFYIAHIVSVLGFMISAWMHHPPLGQWLYIPLAWWAADRLARLLKIAWVNGLGFAGRKPQFAITPSITVTGHGQRHLASLAYAKSSRGHGTMPSSTSSHTYNNSNAGNLPFGGKAGSHSSADAYGQLSSPPDEVGTLVDGQVPSLPHSNSVEGRATVERRATKWSARYDPVHDLITDYVTTGTSSESEPIRHQLEDPGSTPLTSVDTQHQQFGMSRASAFYYDSQDTSDSLPRPHHSTSPQWGLRSLKPRPAMSADVAAVIRPGFAFVQLLPGKTLRLTLRTPNKMSWKPGQWVYLNLPGVRWFESHPFTIASAHDAEFPVSTESADVDQEKGLNKADKVKGEERTIVLLVRARKGFTSHLWNHVVKRRQQQIEAAADALSGAAVGGYESSLLPTGAIGKGTTGVHMRAIVDGPYGSAKRTEWGIHSSVVIVCGGSGVSFGMSALEHLCACIVGAERLGNRGKGGKNFLVQRIRFVWIVREFAHLQWIAAPLRRCIEMLSPEQLSVDLYVTHYNNESAVSHRAQGSASWDFAPPSAPFSTQGTRSSYLSAISTSDLPPSGMTSQAARFTDETEQEEFDVSAYDLTHFDGEDESGPTAAEMEMSKRIRSEGKLRRAATRKATLKKKNGRGLKALVGRSMSSENAKAAAATTPDNKAVPLPYSVEGGAFRSRRGTVTEADLGDRRPHLDGSTHSRNDTLGLDIGAQGGLPGTMSSSQRTAYLSPAPSRPSHLDLPPSPFGCSSFNSQQASANGSGQSTPAYYPRSRRGSASYNSGTLPLYGYQRERSGSFHQAPPFAPGTPRHFDSPLPSEWDPRGSALFSGDGHSRPQSVYPLVSDPGSRFDAISRPQHDDVPIDMDDEEDMDLRVIAEMARPGHPKLDRIVREEVENSRGRILVANCGPKSLDVVLRSIVSKQINLDRVRSGDLRGHVNVVSECFEWGG